MASEILKLMVRSFLLLSMLVGYAGSGLAQHTNNHLLAFNLPVPALQNLPKSGLVIPVGQSVKSRAKEIKGLLNSMIRDAKKSRKAITKMSAPPVPGAKKNRKKAINYFKDYEKYLKSYRNKLDKAADNNKINKKERKSLKSAHKKVEKHRRKATYSLFMALATASANIVTNTAKAMSGNLTKIDKLRKKL